MPDSNRKMPKSAKLRRAPQQDRGIETRDKILDGAKKVLSQDGFEKLSMRGVSVASGVGLGTIYDYYPSKSSILHTLLEDRLKLRLKIFDRTIEVSSDKKTLRDFIDSYLEQMREEHFWSSYDLALNNAADSDVKLQPLMDWYEAETIDRYIRALRVAGSSWTESDLRTVALYLWSVWTQFGPLLENISTEPSHELMEELVRHTFSAILKKVLI